jgi:fatty-acyl-CoA synthase
MRSTMMDVPLSVARILRHGSTAHARSEIVTWTDDGPRRTTFADVGRDAARLAHALRRLGIDGDQRVATYLFNSHEHFTAYLAVPAMGAVLHTLNIRLADDEIAWIAAHAEDDVVIVDAELAERLAAWLPSAPSVRHVIVVGSAPAGTFDGIDVQVHDWHTLLAAEPEDFPWVEDVDERDAAALCYTSGTTGRPRGVAYSHRSIWLHSLQLGSGEGYALADRDRVLVVVPQFHAMGWGFPYAAFMSGFSLVLPHRFSDAASLLAMIERERPTYAAAVPTIWQQVLDAADASKPDLSSLREVVVGGSTLPPSLLDGFESRHGVRLLHAWGMTETSPWGGLGRPPAHAHLDDVAYRLSQGRFPASVQTRLVDDAGAEVPWDGTSVGELEVRGPWVTGSYLGGANPEAFRDGWLRTGDVGSMTPDGYFTITDRTKDVIKSGGEWISSVALENRLTAHPAVQAAAVVAVPDETWGERPLAVVVRRPGADPEFGELRAHVADGPFAPWQVPDLWAWAEAIPHTSTLKTDKVALRAAHAAGALAVEVVRG